MNLGEEEIGIKSAQVGTHSIRRIFAMILHTHGVKKTIIMKLGRWKRDTVLCYIRSQVSGFGKHASKAFETDPGKDFANFPRIVNSRSNHTTTQNRDHNNTPRPVPPDKQPTTEHALEHRTPKHPYKLCFRHRRR